MGILFILVSAIVIAGSVFAYFKYYPIVRIPFKESIDLIDVPVVTFNSREQKLHLLLDTGADDSYLDVNVLPLLGYKSDKSAQGIVISAGAIVNSFGEINLDIKYKDTLFKNTFTIMDMTDAFNAIKERFGVTIHGTIGSKFFNKYKCVLDFKELEMRSK